ncbi:hypothetical protein [Brachybacterium sp. p3-SID957]|uniref:hypothetical protein n=1 Tax=Brachybacterium sp. p3-SID957 TaxID=2916049 RepID=UPI00223B0F81|nr:hypothetical protein [Brachybacterium sp. p3-SID957]MCT1775234.1 hypothetical protein [Brachybacterium sp. p3-SID957]
MITRDLRMARRISELAEEAGVEADPSAPTMREPGLDTANRDVIAPFWAALLTGVACNVHGDDVVDPSKRVPAEPEGTRPAALGTSCGPTRQKIVDALAGAVGEEQSWPPPDVLYITYIIGVVSEVASGAAARGADELGNPPSHTSSGCRPLHGRHPPKIPLWRSTMAANASWVSLLSGRITGSHVAISAPMTDHQFVVLRAGTRSPFPRRSIEAEPDRAMNRPASSADAVSDHVSNQAVRKPSSTHHRGVSWGI